MFNDLWFVLIVQIDTAAEEGGEGWIPLKRALPPIPPSPNTHPFIITGSHKAVLSLRFHLLYSALFNF